MRFLKFLLVMGCLATLDASAQNAEEITLKTTSGDIHGTLQYPATTKKKVPVVLIIPGSGPTDRDGNNIYQVNNSLKMLADSLSHHGIASLRYDKRGIGASKSAMPDEVNLRFDIYVTDVTGWMSLLRQNKKFSKLIVLGHSEGSLIGMLAVVQSRADGYISIAGVADPLDKIMMEQLKASGKMPPKVLDSCRRMFDMVKAGIRIDSVSKGLKSIFRPSVQPYLASWLKYTPMDEIGKVKIPTVIIQGTNDVQVSVEQAQLLHNALPSSKLVTIEGMNHILKNAPADRDQNIATYMMPGLPVKKELVTAIVSFISGLK